MRQLSVIAQTLPVIGGDDDKRLARKAGESIEERAKRVVRPGDFTGVRIVGVPPRELLWWLVRRVRVEDVNPREPLVRLGAGPGKRRGDDRVRATLREREVDGAARLADSIVVDVEAGVQPEALVEREAADERAGREAARLQPRGQRRRHPA